MNKKKNKLLAKKRNKERISRVKELEQLKEKKAELEEKITKQKKEICKQFHIRNLKILASSFHFATPFVLSAGITMGVFRAFGGGIPFHIDEITKYKTYNLDFQSDGYAEMNEEYIKHTWLHTLPDNILVIYTPWKLEENQYVRLKTEYKLKNITTLDLFEAVLEEDYDYITQNLKDYETEKQVTNKIISQNNGYFFEANLHMLDKKEFLKYNETDFKNIIITIIEVILASIIGGIVSYKRDFEFLYTIKKIHKQYKCTISSLEPLQLDLQKTQEKILSLTKMKGEIDNVR